MRHIGTLRSAQAEVRQRCVNLGSAYTQLYGDHSKAYNTWQHEWQISIERHATLLCFASCCGTFTLTVKSTASGKQPLESYTCYRLWLTKHSGYKVDRHQVLCKNCVKTSLQECTAYLNNKQRQLQHDRNGQAGLVALTCARPSHKARVGICLLCSSHFDQHSTSIVQPDQHTELLAHTYTQ